MDELQVALRPSNPAAAGYVVRSGCGFPWRDRVWTGLEVGVYSEGKMLEQYLKIQAVDARTNASQVRDWRQSNKVSQE